MLIGNDDGLAAVDAGKLHVTLHHNYFNTVSSRSPLARFGVIHAYNNYHRNMDTAVALRTGATGFVENSVFDNTDGSIHAGQGTNPSCITQTGNSFINGAAQPDVRACPANSKPTYSYR